MVEAGGGAGKHERVDGRVRDLRNTPRAIERLRSEMLPASIVPTALGRAALVALVSMLTSLALPWRVRTGIGPASLSAGEGFEAVGVLGLLGGIVGLGLVVSDRKLAEPPAGPLALIGAVFGAFVVHQLDVANDVDIEIYLLGPALALASSVCLITIGGLAQWRPSALLATESKTIPKSAPVSSGNDLDALEEAVDSLEADVRAQRAAVKEPSYDGAWLVVVAGLALWLAGLFASWAVTGHGDQRASLSGFTGVETLPSRLALLAAAGASATAFISTSWRRPSCFIALAAALAGIGLAWRARAAIEVAAPIGAIGVGSGAVITILGGVLVAGGSARLVTLPRPSSREFGWAGLAVTAALALAFAAAVPSTEPQVYREGFTMIGGGEAPLSPLIAVSDASVSDIAVDGSTVYLVDYSDQVVSPIVGGRVGSPIGSLGYGSVSDSRILGTVDHQLFTFDGSTVFSVDLPGTDHFETSGSDTHNLVSDARSAVLGPDGALWFIDNQGRLHRISDATDLDSTSGPIDLGPDRSVPNDLLGAGNGRVYAAIDQDRRIIEITPDGTTRTVVGGIGVNSSCGPSNDATRTAMSTELRERKAVGAVEDGAGNVWIDIDGSDLWVVRRSDGAVVTPLGAIGTLEGTAAIGLDYQGLTAGASTDHSIALTYQRWSNDVVVRIDDAAQLIAGLGAAPPDDKCQPLVVDATDAPTFDVRRFLTSEFEFTTTVATDVVVRSAGVTTIERPGSLLTIDDVDLAPYGEVRGGGDGGLLWTTAAGDLVIVGADDSVTTVEHQPGEFFSDVLVTDDQAAVVMCSSSECGVSTIGLIDLSTASAELKPAVKPGPRFNDNWWMVELDTARNRVLIERLDQSPAWMSTIDGSLEAIGQKGDTVLSIDADGNVYVTRISGLIRISDNDVEELLIATPTEEPLSTLTQLDRQLDDLDLFVHDAVVGSNQMLFVSTSDGIVLRVFEDGDVSYVAGGGPYIAGANMSLTGSTSLELTADRLVITTWDTIASTPLEGL
jgi:hypothetical protein